MKTGPKYKIARRLGASVFEKTQTQKFALFEQKRKNKKFVRNRTIYGTQLLEKQKVRFTYGISEKQFANYIKKTIAAGHQNQASHLYSLLESRLDAVVLNAGLASTRGQARQYVSHGHIKVNGKKVTIPSYQVSKGDLIEVREKSHDKGFFRDVEERSKELQITSWLKVNPKEFAATVVGAPEYNQKESNFDLQTVLQFYKR